jgi:hypothetical protein
MAIREKRGLFCLPTSKNTRATISINQMSNKVHCEGHVVGQLEKLINLLGFVEFICNVNEHLFGGFT